MASDFSQGAGTRDNVAAISPTDTVVVAEDEDRGFVDRRIDLAISAVVMFVGAFLVYASYGIRRGSIPDPIGSGGWARVLGIALVISGGVLVFRRLASWRSEAGNLVPSDGGKDGEAGIPSSNLRPYLVVAAGFGWIYFVKIAGFIVPTIVLTSLIVGLMRVRSLNKLLVVPVVFTFLIWGIFGQVFGIHFPAGPIEKWLQGLLETLF